METEMAVVSFYDEELELIEDNVKLYAVPRIGELVYLGEDSKYQVINIVHRIKRLPNHSDYTKVNVILSSI